ncbi:hypothetical protein AU468_08330 [Alkalispirochaeta sphaeroplastigenens]|uniref:Uncharacterized protein n=1 Tax=Alkalispirochaeta sphaeroplastigenens TaxID=1187066 RepID=A0A2S4JP48_9SPIO|nr:hypothetical protein [Alkalispirochaeta sphaeroplastigenens]POR01314.1 hypothetical protein AU468_08330 [Alkalispirochaeta sphaeroplastigenens]
MTQTDVRNTVATRNRTKDLQLLLQDEHLQLHRDEDWQALAEHVEVHKFLINQSIPWTITWDDAIFSWYENVYTPLNRAIDHWEVRGAFPGKTRGQLYLAVSSHWYYLQQRNPLVTADEAARDFSGRYGTGLARWFSRYL